MHLAFTTSFLAFASLVACESPTDADPFESPDASVSTGGTSSGGGTSTGGSSVSGGAPASGGASTGGSSPVDAEALYECQARPHRDPGGTAVEDSPCCIFDAGICKSPDEIEDEILARAYGHDSCAPDLKCVPTPAALADGGALGAFSACTWTVGSQNLEGRCVPGCFVQGHPAAGFLKQGTCDAEFVCAPCFSPIDGESTGACTISPGDAPADPAPAPFAPCGATPPDAPPGPPGGLCAPRDLVFEVDNAAIASLEQLECAGGELCAPALKVNDTSACFEPCESVVGSLLGERYTAGGCVPSFVISLVEPVATPQLTQGTCAEGELCAPCVNPLSGDAPTGACQ
jgi:hypothetical protein